jgi:hypothetical protein
MRILTTSLLSLTLALGLTLPATAASLAGVTMQDKVDVDGQTLTLNGMALRKKLFIKVYVAGLYLPQKTRDARQALAGDTPHRMVMDFLYGVSKDQMCDAWNEGLEANTPNASAGVKKSFQTLCDWMEPIDKGNQLVLTYLPGQGTKVEVNGKVKGTLPGADVADAILATWIGPKPGPGEDFKKGLLGG